MSTVQARISAFESLTTHADPIDFLESPPPAMVTASLQPVIAATRPSPSPSPPGLGRKTSLIDLKDWVVDDGLFPPPRRSSNTRMAFSQLKSANPSKGQSQEHSSIPAGPTGNLPLIDLHSPQKSKPKPKPKPANLTSAPSQTAVSSKQRPPQLPPRKTSHTSLKSAAPSSPPQLNFLYPPRRQDSLTVAQGLEPHSRGSSHAQSSSVSSFHSVSLSSDTDTSRPGSISNFIATFPMERDHSSSSANSGAKDIDSISLTESFEEVSASALTSPVTEEQIEWQYATRKPPKLPERPPSTNSTSKIPSSQPRRGTLKAAAGSGPPSPVLQPSLSRHSSVSTLNNAAPPYSPYTPRRAAPPPPPPSRSSDRSSILSNATTQSFSSHSSHSYQSPPSLPGAPIVTLKIKRPTPVPLAARRRYEIVFIKNTLQQRKAQKEKEKPGLLSPPSEVARNRRAAGWRGLSVDLIVDPEGPMTNGAQSSTPQSQRVVDETVENDDKLEGMIVRLVWKKSGLDSTRLAEIWYVTFPIPMPERLTSAKGMNVILRAKVLSPLTALSKACGELTKSFGGRKPKPSSRLARIALVYIATKVLVRWLRILSPQHRRSFLQDIKIFCDKILVFWHEGTETCYANCRRMCNEPHFTNN